MARFCWRCSVGCLFGAFLCIHLQFLTFYRVAVGINGTYQGCNSRYVMPSDTEPGTLIWVGTMFQRVPIGIVACVFSLSTNLLATILIAYKTWYVMTGVENIVHH